MLQRDTTSTTPSSNSASFSVSLAPKISRGLAFTLLACWPAMGFSAPAADTLDTLVVTGTRTAKSQQDSPVRTEIIDHAELQRTHARSLKQALQNLPGLQLSPVHGKSGYQVSLQGMNSDQVLVLINGLPISDSTGSTTDVSQYAVANIDHIEVVKGATSAQYGSSAMGGVINVITRAPRPGTRLDVEADSGSYGHQNLPAGNPWRAGLNHGRVNIAGGTQAWRGQLSAAASHDNGFSVDPDGWARQGDASKRRQYNARLDWLPTAATHAWLAGNFYHEADASRYLGDVRLGSQPERHRENIQRNRFSGGASGSWQGIKADIKGVHESYRSRLNEFSNGELDDKRHADTHLDHLSGQLTLPYWHRQVWTLGADYDRHDLEQIQGHTSELKGGRVTRTSHELFVQDDIFLGRDWELLLGGRWQKDSDFGNHAVPKAALRYSLPLTAGQQANVRLSYGEGYRVPNLKERHYLFDHSARGYQVLGNPNLKPERSKSWQLGFNYQWKTRFSAHLNLFSNRIRDLIQVDRDHAPIIHGIQRFSYKNVGRARTRGVETSLSWQALDKVTLKGAYTYTSAIDTGNDISLTHRPRHIARASVDWQLTDSTSVSLRDRYQGRERVASDGGYSPAWNRLDVTFNHTLPLGFSAFVGINNLFNKQREFTDADDFSPASGRLVYLGFRYHWEKPASNAFNQLGATQ